MPPSVPGICMPPINSGVRTMPPMPTPAFWNHMDTLYALHDRLKDAETKKLLQQLILAIQAEATQPKEVTDDGNHPL